MDPRYRVLELLGNKTTQRFHWALAPEINTSFLCNPSQHNTFRRTSTKTALRLAGWRSSYIELLKQSDEGTNLSVSKGDNKSPIFTSETKHCTWRNWPVFALRQLPEAKHFEGGVLIYMVRRRHGIWSEKTEQDKISCRFTRRQIDLLLPTIHRTRTGALPYGSKYRNNNPKPVILFFADDFSTGRTSLFCALFPTHSWSLCYKWHYRVICSFRTHKAQQNWTIGSNFPETFGVTTWKATHFLYHSQLIPAPLDLRPETTYITICSLWHLQFTLERGNLYVYALPPK